MKLLVHISRIFVGIMFVFSGFVKLVDPIGSQYKFEEYFSEYVLDMEFLVPYALQFSILLILNFFVVVVIPLSNMVFCVLLQSNRLWMFW